MIKQVSIDRIHPNPFNVRKRGSEGMSAAAINSLADEIEKLGWWNTILKARPLNGGGYELAFGARRLAALKKLGKKTLEIDVDDLTDEQMKFMGSAENFQRHGLEDGERVAAWKQVKEICGGRTGEAAKLLGIGEKTAAAYNDALEYEPEETSVRKISARALSQAKRLGGERMIATAARLGLGEKKLESITTRINKAAEKGEAAKSDLVKAAIAGKIKSPEDVPKVAKQLRHAALDEHIKKGKEKAGPPDLLKVIGWWVKELPEICDKIEEVGRLKEYADYIVEGDPKLASEFKKVLRRLVSAAHRLETNIVPRLTA